MKKVKKGYHRTKDGQIIYGKYKYQNAHYDCVKQNDLKPKSSFDW
jgi:hypothetical protein